MFGMFKKAPELPPVLEVKDFQQGQLEVKAPKVMAKTPLQAVTLKMPDGTEVSAKVTVDSGLDDQLIYWLKLESPLSLVETLVALFPPAVVEEIEVVPTWEEKRSEQRSPKVLGIMSREIPGFKTVCHDVSSNGVRINSDKELEPGRPIAFSLDLDDARIPPLPLEGQILWCQPREPKGFWLGVKYTKISPAQQATLDKFLDEARKLEAGTITRDYAAD